MNRLTLFEAEIVRCLLDNDYEYLIRDEYGDLYAYRSEYSPPYSLTLFNNHFQEIKQEKMLLVDMCK